MPRDIKIICTVGPSSRSLPILKRFKARGVALVRINLSHIDLGECESYILDLSRSGIPIAIDTEGAQIRTGRIGAGCVSVRTGDTIRIHRQHVECDQQNLYLTPHHVVDSLEPGQLIEIDFNSVLLQVEDTSTLGRESYVTCRVVVGGALASRKGVHCSDLNCALDPFSEKDLRCVEIGQRYGIRHYTLSFMSRADDVVKFRSLCPDSVLYAKIETNAGVRNMASILGAADGILIDRGDLSRDIPVEKMPLMQKVLIEAANLRGKEALIASNLLETMASDLKPTRAETSDIVNSIIDGVGGFVLTKETAVGKYPAETVNMLKALIQQGRTALAHSTKRGDHLTASVDLKSLGESPEFVDPDASGSIVRPHGGRLVERCLDTADANGWGDLPRLEVDDRVVMDLEQIGIGTYSPLEGFLSREDYQSVLDHMRLRSGVPWPLPIVLTIGEEDRRRLSKAERIALVSKEDGEVYGLLDVGDIYPYDKGEYAGKVFGTEDQKHPGVAQLREAGEFLISGKIHLRQRRRGAFHKYNLTPRQARKVFSALGWLGIVGFHTRNVIHRAHEHIQLQALERTGCDGLFVHPVVGRKKKGDFDADVIVRGYEIMIEKYYPKNRVVLGLFSTYSRYAGPREAIFTALCRQNFGCSHFVVGRDHTGVKDFYPPTASQEIFAEFKDIAIVPVFFGDVAYSPDLDRYMDEAETAGPGVKSISGTEIRGILGQGNHPPQWLMRPEVADLVIGKMSNGESVFV